jgi:D-tagatose-bisphosphate aldolase class II non-catalytic subunit
MARVVVIGEILVEMMARDVGQTFLRPGQFMGPYASGAPAIFAEQAARTGCEVALIGTVGCDDFGTLNVERLRRSGVDVSHIRRHASLPTGSAFVTYAADGSRSFVFNIAHSAAGAITDDQVDPQLFKDCRFFHVMGSSLLSAEVVAAAQKGIELAKRAGAQVSFDPNVRKELLANPQLRDAIQAILRKTDILLPSEDDIRHLFPAMNEQQAAAQLLAAGVRMIALKRGAKGCTFFAKGKILDVPAIPSEEIDPTGAGDCFGGTFISSLAQGVPADRALVLANAAGALAVRARGPMEGSSRLIEIERYIEECQTPRSALAEITRLFKANRSGEAKAIYSVCSAHHLVLEAACEQARRDGSVLLIEATCNQVNQDGGYTGMTPVDFREYAHRIAARMSFPLDNLVLGGDHLGPNPWQHLPAKAAMEKACDMVAAYAAAGFAKIHLDASMPCQDDPRPLSNFEIGKRAARLCQAAENAIGDSACNPLYIIGTEVPVPGGAVEELEIEVTRSASLEETLDVHRQAFAALSLASAWDRVVGVVVQPGVEFGDETVAEFIPEKANQLASCILRHEGLVFEAHSTDYQSSRALRALVEHHFGILKVGPELTFVMREAIFGLARIEEEWVPQPQRSNLRSVIEETMLEHPENWKKYYRGNADQLRFSRAYSRSDRIRYYWPAPTITEALEVLLRNLTERPAPLPLLSQYLPNQAEAVRDGVLANEPTALIHHKVRDSLLRYATACGLAKRE